MTLDKKEKVFPPSAVLCWSLSGASPWLSSFVHLLDWCVLLYFRMANFSDSSTSANTCFKWLV
jgi:hypothetical protein